MSMDRAQLAGFLWGKLGGQFTEVDITNSDTTGNLKEPLDETFVALGTPYADVATGTISTADTHKGMILVRYYGLLTVYDRALNRVDSQKSTGAPSVSKSENKSQFVRQLENALFRARENAEPFLPNGGGWAVGGIELDILGCSPEGW